MKILVLVFTIIYVLTANAQSVKGESNELKFTESNKQVNSGYTYKIISSVDSTWCYDIYKDNKLLIHQTSIPGLPGNKGFQYKSDAEKVAGLVIGKLEKGEMPPGVTQDELKKLKVL